MAITWQTSGYNRSSSRRYTIPTPDFPGGEWATDQLSSLHDRVVAGMDDIAEQGYQDVRGRVIGLDRIDTGLMLASVHSNTVRRASLIEVSFGWYGGDPHYAIYQEFGTRTGIEAMQAVHDAFHRAQDALRAVIAG